MKSYSSNPIRFTGSVLDLFAGVLIYFSLFLRDIIGISLPAEIYLLSLAAGLMLLVLRSSKNLKHNDLVFIVLISIFILLNVAPKGEFYLNNYLIAPIVGLLLVRVIPRVFFRILVFHMLLSLSIQMLEVATGSYVFVTETKEGLILDSEFFGGSVEVFRAKGMFQGPLSAVGFYLLMGLLGQTRPFLFGSFVGSVMSYGRLGILISSTMMITGLFRNNRSFALALIVVSLILVTNVFSFSFISVSFFLSAFDLESSGNLMRMYFWEKALDTFLQYEWYHLIFGNVGYATSVGIFPESDFLRLLLDCGILGLILYVLALYLLYRKRYKSNFYGLVFFSCIIAAMSIFPFLQSLNAAVLFWFLFFSGHTENGT